jgi:large subunit ribosomal protein L25
VLYGHGEKPVHIALPAREFAAAIRHGGANQVFAIDVTGGASTLALAKAIQKDPIKDTYEHVDLIIVKRGEKVTVDVPVVLTGEAARNALVVTESTTLSLTAEALHLPESVEVSIEGLEPGAQITAGDVTLPKGSELAADPATVVVLVSGGSTAEPEAGAAAEGGEESADAEG